MHKGQCFRYQYMTCNYKYNNYNLNTNYQYPYKRYILGPFHRLTRTRSGIYTILEQQPCTF